MIYGRLQIASPALRDAVYSHPDPAPYESRSVTRLSGRLSVLDGAVKNREFDTVQIFLRGIIAASIGYRHAIEDIITLTDMKSLSDFHSCHGGQDSEHGRHVDFFFELPASTSSRDGHFRHLPLSTSVSGNTSVTQHSALNDRLILQGECEVFYWIEAKFQLRGQRVGFVSQNVQAMNLYPNLRLSLAKGQPLTVEGKPDLLTRCRLKQTPNLLVTLYEPDVTVQRDESGKRTITIPVAITLDAKSTSGRGAFDARQSAKCTVDAKWEINWRWGVVPVLSSMDEPKTADVIYKTSPAATQKTEVLLRPLPLYDAAQQKTNSYIATSEIKLTVPGGLSQPSLKWDHMSRAYTLELSLSISGLQGAPKYHVRTRVPVTVHAVGLKTGDDEGELPAESPGARTPPPAYFR